MLKPEKSRKDLFKTSTLASKFSTSGLDGSGLKKVHVNVSGVKRFKDISSDLEKLEWIRTNLSSPLICDSLDTCGIPVRTMNGRIRPIHPDYVIAGRTRTVLWMDIYEPVEKPYEMEITAVDSLKPGDVSVHSTDFTLRNAPWGDLMSTAAKMRGAVGAIIDSNTRDIKKIIELGFPVFTAGIKPLDSQGRGYVVDYDCTIECGDVRVVSGELVVADYDGVVVVPKDAENEVLRIAEEKCRAEDKTRKELMKGRSLREVYEKYGVL